jgi:hypothetical protein
MAGEFDVGAPTLQVNVYEGGRLITQIPSESAEEAPTGTEGTFG